MKPRPTAIGLETAANFFSNLLPDFNKMSLEDQERSRNALRIVANMTLVLRAELGDACPSCGMVIAEGVAH